MHGFVIVAECSAEYARVMVDVGPNYNRFGVLGRNNIPSTFTFRLVLVSGSESLGAFEDLHIVVKLFRSGSPVCHAFGDGVFLSRKVYYDWLFGAVSA